MKLYCGIDLHSTNHLVSIINEDDKPIYRKRLKNELNQTLQALAPYQQELVGVAVESTFNWYWLVDGLNERWVLRSPGEYQCCETVRRTEVYR